MSYICVICDESLAYDCDPNKTSKYGKIITTICGHVYHGYCLEAWFEASKRKQELEEALRESNSNSSRQYTPQKRPSISVPCPICHARIFMHQCIRTFPSEDLGSNALSKKMRENPSVVTSSSINFSSEPSPSTSKTNNASCSSMSKLQELKRLVTLPLKSTETETTKGGLVIGIGDIVVWFREDNKEIGSIIWIGTIDGVLNAYVKFISPIGDSSSETKEEELINYDTKYCKMLPVSHLILYVDCFGCQGVENSDSKPN